MPDGAGPELRLWWRPVLVIAIVEALMRSWALGGASLCLDEAISGLSARGVALLVLALVAASLAIHKTFELAARAWVLRRLSPNLPTRPADARQA